MILRFKTSGGDRLNVDTEKRLYSCNASDVSDIYILMVDKLVIARIEDECDFNDYECTKAI